MPNIRFYDGNIGETLSLIDNGLSSIREGLTNVGPGSITALPRAVNFNDDAILGSAVPWTVSGGTSTFARTTSANEWNTGGAGFKYTTSTVSAQTSGWDRGSWRRGASNILRYGAVFACQDANPSYFEFRIAYFDGVNRNFGTLRFTTAGTLWQYDIGGAGSQSLSTLLTRAAVSPSATLPFWHHIEIVIDIAAKKYVAFTIDDQFLATTAIQAQGLRSVADATVPNGIKCTLETLNITGSPTAGVILVDQIYCVSGY